MPTLFDFTTSQYNDPAYQQSFWSSSYLTCTDNSQFLVLSHVLNLPTGGGWYRASVFDFQTLAFEQFTTVTNLSSQVSANLNAFNYTFDDWEMGSAMDDPLGLIHTASRHPGVGFDITFDLNGPALLNAGVGWFAIGKGHTGEWATPAGHTTGSVLVEDKKFEIDPARSLTWYDRQWVSADAQASNWTWFELHFDSDSGCASEKLSIWILDDLAKVNPRKQFATTRTQHGVHTLLPVTSFQEHSDGTWKSPYSNVTYHQGWDVTLLDGTSITIKSAAGYQELHDPTGKLVVTYEGFVTVTGVRNRGEAIQGWGLVEINPALPSQ